MSNLRRYHHKVYFNENTSTMMVDFIKSIAHLQEIIYTAHAEQRRKTKTGTIPKATKQILFNPSNTLIEYYEILNNDGSPTKVIQKLVIRVHHLSDIYDYTYVLSREGVVISNWVNKKTDIHSLEKSKDIYYIPKERQQ